VKHVAPLRSRLAIGLGAVVVAAALGSAIAAGAAARAVIARLDAEREAVRDEHARTALTLVSARIRLRAALAGEGASPPVDEVFADGTVARSAAWPESSGVRRDPPVLPPAGGAVWSVPTAAGPRPAWVVRPDGAPDGHVRIVGVWLDGAGEFADGLSSVGAVAGRGPAAGRPGRIDLPAAAGEAPWALILDRSASPSRSVDRVVAVAAVGALVSAVVAALAGWWVVRAATRPLEAVARAFEAVAAGRADYDFPPSREAAFGEVVASYSRMQRALEVERARVRAVERVAAWKETARRVAHEVKNPLVPIRLTVENLIKARERVPERFDDLFASGTTAILEEVERLQRVVSEFSAYARLPEPRPVPEDLDAIVDSVIALRAGDGRVRIRRERRGAVPPLPLDRDLVAQAVRNVLDNAVRESAASGGEVVVTTGVDGGAAFVDIRDDGPGFDPGMLERAFEPYVTAREGGTGLGLAIAQRIAVEHGGVLRAANAAGAGAVVTLSLPIPDAEVA